MRPPGEEAALLAQLQAHQAALVATQAAADAFGTLRSSAGDSVRIIRAFAESQTKPSVIYNLAQIPPPASPSPAPPPAQPTDLTVRLDASGGNLTLRWKAANPAGTSGTSYIVRRRLPGESEFAFIGVSGKKEFVDDTLIAGPDSVQYTVQGQRADSSGPLSEIFTLNFGQNAGGAFAAVMASGYGLEARAKNHGLETRDTHDGLETRPTASTVNGHAVEKVLANVGRNGTRTISRL